jgi:hypothetical protein
MARTVREVAHALDEVQRQLPPTDGVKWFAWLYADVTRAIVTSRRSSSPLPG